MLENVSGQLDEDEILEIEFLLNEAKGLYDYYRILMQELEDCIKNYNLRHKKSSGLVIKNIRKLNSDMSKK